MIRLVLGDDGSLAVDLAGRSFGRGAWVHPRPDCLSLAPKGGLQKSFKSKVSISEADMFDSVRSAGGRRVDALLGSARGAGKLACGSDVAEAAFKDGKGKLLIVAEDARATAQAPWVLAAGGAGRAIFWGTKERLGRAVGRPDTALVAVCDGGFAEAVARAVALSTLPGPDLRRAGGERPMVEVR
jgi:predicted RNA-binding protein YlxR (DUF448 family)/ribosomal protein L7Ae-like RNA K-turn-binding protein